MLNTARISSFCSTSKDTRQQEVVPQLALVDRHRDHMLRFGQLASGKPAIGPDVLLDGFGLERTTAGALYTGQFRDGLRHGRGVLSGSDAHGERATFDGLWRKGIREGRGVEFTPSRVHSVICVGVWENGSKHGAFRCLLDGSKHASMVKLALLAWPRTTQGALALAIPNWAPEQSYGGRLGPALQPWGRRRQ